MSYTHLSCGRVGAVTRSSALRAASLALAGLAVVQGAPGLTALGPVRRRLFPRLSGAGRPGKVALTFDDGPDPRCTPAFLEVLAARRVRATFFLLGPMAAKAPALAAEIAAAGHDIAVHGWHHRYPILRSPRALRDDLARAVDAVAAASGVRPRFYRPPYGVLSAGALAAAHGLGLTPVLWTTWGREWVPGATAESVLAALTASLADGGCVLLHDSDCTSPAGSAAAALQALPPFLDLCGQRALTVGPLSTHRR
ncbi:MAG: polysaccharide deacetylase family protein [Actinobacteria bacterium]|nr:polysaccharide deacetylase family protein [Actinomycetota bacterium]